MAQRRHRPTPKDPNQIWISIWLEDGVVTFKVGRIRLGRQPNDQALEKAAKARARDIGAQVTYAWNREAGDSNAWWLEWGGFDLEGEILFEAITGRPKIAQRIAALQEGGDGKRLDDYLATLLDDQHLTVTEDEVRAGFRRWLENLDPKANSQFGNDMRAWLRTGAS